MTLLVFTSTAVVSTCTLPSAWWLTIDPTWNYSQQGSLFLGKRVPSSYIIFERRLTSLCANMSESQSYCIDRTDTGRYYSDASITNCPLCMAGEQSDRCQRKHITLSFVLDFLPGPWGWGWLLALTVKQRCLPSSLKTSADIGDKHILYFKPQSHPLNLPALQWAQYTEEFKPQAAAWEHWDRKGRCVHTQHTAGVGCRGRCMILSVLSLANTPKYR